MIGRTTQVVDCRESMGLAKGGGLAQRGTLSEATKPDVIAIAMSPGRRHITKPVCEMTYGLRTLPRCRTAILWRATCSSSLSFSPKVGP